MRKFSRQYLSVHGKKFYLVSVKTSGVGWEPIALFQKSNEKDEFGFKITGEKLECPHIDEVSRFDWIPLPNIWLCVRTVCQKCWGSHRTSDGRYNCILRSLDIRRSCNQNT